GRIRADWLDDLPAVALDRLTGFVDVVDHDVEQHARRTRRASSGDERAADFAGGVVERLRAVTALAHLPSERASVERGRLFDVGRGQLEIADLAVLAVWHLGQADERMGLSRARMITTPAMKIAIAMHCATLNAKKRSSLMRRNSTKNRS